jgi:hypothetical protein
MEAYAASMPAMPPAGDVGEPAGERPSPIEDDRPRRHELRTRLLLALATYGLHDRKGARRQLGDILRDDPNCGLAADFLLWLEWQ